MQTPTRVLIDNDGRKPEWIPVAQIGVENAMYTYMDLKHNKTFVSKHPDPEEAYLNYCDNLRYQKSIKQRELKKKQTESEDMMTRLMMCCMVGYGVFKITDNTIIKSQSIVRSFFSQLTMIPDSIVEVYFTVGVQMEMEVYQPDQIFKRCQTDLLDRICSVVVGMQYLTTAENIFYKRVQAHYNKQC